MLKKCEECGEDFVVSKKSDRFCRYPKLKNKKGVTRSYSKCQYTHSLRHKKAKRIRSPLPTHCKVCNQEFKTTPKPNQKVCLFTDDEKKMLPANKRKTACEVENFRNARKKWYENRKLKSDILPKEYNYIADNPAIRRKKKTKLRECIGINSIDYPHSFQSSNPFHRICEKCTRESRPYGKSYLTVSNVQVKMATSGGLNHE